MVKVITPMVESKLSFFETQVEGTICQVIELGLASLRITPEIFDTVDVAFARGELFVPVVDSEILVETDINQTLVTWSAVPMNERSRFNVTPDEPLHCGLGSIRHDLCVDHADA